jgi:hypothetical protein
MQVRILKKFHIMPLAKEFPESRHIAGGYGFRRWSV